MSKRGQSSCPGCKATVFNRCKTERCTTCNFYLGGKYQPKPKQPKLYAPACVFLYSCEGCSFYSVKTHSKDSRCFVTLDEHTSHKQCSFEKCRSVRLAFVNSSQPELFTCDHIQKTTTAVEALKTHQLSEQLIHNYACDEPTKTSLRQLQSSFGSASVFQVSDKSFCVVGAPSSSNTLGYCHVKRGDNIFLCSSKGCGGYVGKTKGAKQKKICLHLHVLLCVLGKSSATSSSVSVAGPSSDSNHAIASSPSGSHDQSLSGRCPPLISTSCHQDLPAPDLSTPAPSYQHGLSSVVNAPVTINPAVHSNDPHLRASSKPALSSSEKCVAPTLPNHIPSVSDHQNNSSSDVSAQSTLSLSALPSDTSFYGPSPSSVPHHPGSTVAIESSSSLPKSTESDMRSSTVKINLQREVPYVIPSHILIRIQEMDSKFISSGLGGDSWPKSYSPTEELCALCGVTLGASRPHTGQKRGESGYLLTNCVPLEPIKILVKQCGKCKGLHQVFPYELGLINISDKILVSVDTLLDLREQFKRGVPLTTAIESKLANILRKATKKVSVSREYVVDLLYNGFYYFEMITKRNLDDTICGICGVIGETYFGGGNEKNCCSRKEIVYDTPGVNEANPMTFEDFLQLLKSFWVERASFTRTLKPFSVKAFSVPPIIAPKLTGPVIFNSEMEKKSAYLGDSKKKIKGDPALLHLQIRELGIDMNSISKMTTVELKDLCAKCSIPVTSNMSEQALCNELQQLYATLLAGDCPCHGFTHVHGYTGGFYHLVCRHGITVASKFLTLQESVRDAADLYLSLRYPPPVFICDTPCGFVRHVDCRSKDVSKLLWGKYSGCFEEPTQGKVPTQGISVPSLVPAEFRTNSNHQTDDCEENGRWIHPVTGSSRRYVLGDRFHSSSNPHKSPLCDYHDINLCLQANTMKISYQESENHRKNMKRLRSACVQGFGTHFLYNYLMDFYQNEVVIEKQLETLKRGLQSSMKIARDRFMRFVYVPANPIT